METKITTRRWTSTVAVIIVDKGEERRLIWFGMKKDRTYLQELLYSTDTNHSSFAICLFIVIDLKLRWQTWRQRQQKEEATTIRNIVCIDFTACVKYLCRKAKRRLGTTGSHVVNTFISLVPMYWKNLEKDNLFFFEIYWINRFIRWLAVLTQNNVLQRFNARIKFPNKKKADSNKWCVRVLAETRTSRVKLRHPLVLLYTHWLRCPYLCIARRRCI